MEGTESNSNIYYSEFNPEIWDNKLFEWNGKRFIFTKIKTIFCFPINYGRAMRKLTNFANSVHAISQDNMCLMHSTSMWKTDLYLTVDQYIKDADNISLSGSFYTKVYEGNIKDKNKWKKNFKQLLQNQQILSRQIYIWYTNSPKLFKKYDKNYVVLIAKIYDKY